MVAAVLAAGQAAAHDRTTPDAADEIPGGDVAEPADDAPITGVVIEARPGRAGRLGLPAVPAFAPMFRGAAPLSTPGGATAGIGAGLGLLSTLPQGDFARAADCMALAIAYEAGNQPIAGQQAVGQVILNRMRAARFPKSVCGVVFQGSQRLTGCQFTFTCDGSLARQLRDTTWATARSVAETVLIGAAPDRVGGATHYHADYVLPYWAATGARVAQIGAHVFYRMPGDGASTAGYTPGDEAIVPPAPALRTRRPVRTLARFAATAPAAARPMFQPWGLPVNGAPGR